MKKLFKEEMMKHILLIICCTVLISCETTEIESVSSMLMTNTTGSGYEDLRGSVVNYGYDDFDDFDLAVYNNKIKWLGQKAYFKGIAQEVDPTISKVTEGIYYMSWSLGNGGDNVVHNYNSMRVNAHLDPANGQRDTLSNIHGDVYSINAPETRFPHAEPIPFEKVGPTVVNNIQTMNLPALVGVGSIFPEDIVAGQELEGLEIEYETPYGPTKIKVYGEVSRISENRQDLEEYQIYATKIDEDIYFLSWTPGNGGNHILINRKTMQVFDHRSPTFERAEAVYPITYFGEQRD